MLKFCSFLYSFSVDVVNVFLIRILLGSLLLFFPLWVSASVETAADLSHDEMVEMLTNSPTSLISEKVQEPYSFYGLASYYNNISYYIIENDDHRRIENGDVIELNKEEWLAVVGRFNVLLIRVEGLLANLDEAKLVINDANVLHQPNAIVMLVTKPELPSIAPELDQIRYVHLWAPFSWLAKIVESSLDTIKADIVGNWGLVIIVFSILLKLLLLPVSIMTVQFQRRVSQVQAILAPQLAEIKANYDGEEAHERLMAAHKSLGVSPFYTLKPMLGSIVQIPILIAVFNALGEMPQLNGYSFLWIENFVYPDVVGYLSFGIPMFGDTISLLPFIMTAVTLYSTIIFQNRHAPEAEMKRQKRNLYLMAVAFFVLFYPFPAAMVLYWTLSNILHIIQQKIIKI